MLTAVLGELPLVVNELGASVIELRLEELVHSSRKRCPVEQAFIDEQRREPPRHSYCGSRIFARVTETKRVTLYQIQRDVALSHEEHDFRHCLFVAAIRV